MTNPSDANPVTDEQLHGLIAEYHDRIDRGESIDAAGFCAEHSAFADQLRRYFDNVATVEDLAGPTAGANLGPEGTMVTSETAAVGHDQTVVEESASQTNNVRIASDAPPTQFGRYRILSELGRGAMGAVYLAQDEQLDRKVALKIPQFGGAMNKGLLERFYREARAAGNLRHTGICPVYDVGEISGQHYITMAYIEGRPLRDFSKSSKRQTGKQTARVIRKIALAMAEAHEHHVIHRDLKPANVMIDTKNEPVVMDFGLARRTADMEEKLTHTGTVIGTPAYMSPEQVDGDNSNVGPPADIYSLGVMFYELLTGELPFQGSLMSILKQISMKDPRPPVELHGDIDPFLQDLCLKMLAKEASDRPASMADVAKSLSDWLQGLHAPTDESGMLETSRVPGQKKGMKKTEQLEATEPITVPGEPRFEPDPEKFAVSDSDEGLSETQRRVQKPPPSKNRGLLITAALGGIALLTGIVFFVNLGGKYDVKITVDDPSISLKVDGDDVIIDGAGSPIRLSAGTHSLRMERDGLEADLKEFTVKEKGENLVHVVVIDGRFAVNPPDQPDVNTAPLPSGTEYALQFDGVSSHVVIPETMFEDLEKFTIELTIDAAEKRDEESSGAMLSVVHSDRRRIRISDASRRGMFIREEQQQYRVVTEYESGRIQVAGVFDGSELRVYQDGALIGKAAAGGRGATHTGKPHALIGAAMKEARVGPPIKEAFLGTVDEVRISRVPRYDSDYKPKSRLESDEDTVALYHFDEGQGDVLKDSSGNDHHGKIVGATWVKSDSRPATRSNDTVPVVDVPESEASGNYALQFTRVEEGETLHTVQVPTLEDRTASLTIETWFNPTNPNNHDQLEPITVLVGFGVRQRIGGDPRGMYNYLAGSDPDGPNGFLAVTVPTADVQKNRGLPHLAAVRDALNEEIRFYVNGNTVGSHPFGSVETGGTLTFGFEHFRTQVNGRVDEARISSVARYAANFTPARRFESDAHTLALYHFDEGQGDVLKDSSGNNHHGKIVGAKWIKSGSASSGTPPAAGIFGLNFDDCTDESAVTAELDVTPDASTIEAWITPTRLGAKGTFASGTHFAIITDRTGNSESRVDLGARTSSQLREGVISLRRQHVGVVSWSSSAFAVS